MGVTLALIANGTLGANSAPPVWVIASSAVAISLGTYSGGWRIIRTTGTRIIKMDAAQGFSAQGAGAAVILASTHFGFPRWGRRIVTVMSLLAAVFARRAQRGAPVEASSTRSRRS